MKHEIINMKHEIIPTDKYLLVVDDSEIKVDDYCTTHLNVIDAGKIHNSYTIFNPQNKEQLEMVKSCKKIIAHLPLKDSPVLEGVDLLPPLEQEDDVEKLAEKEFPNSQFGESYENKRERNGYIKGYTKAREKYKFTEEDVRKAISMVKKNWTDEVTNEEKIIQSLSQPKIPIGFECEMKFKQMPDFHKDEPKTTTNTQGQTVWVGKYSYNQI